MRDEIKKVFGESLSKQRHLASLTLEGLADKSGLTLRYVQDLEAGNKLPSILTLAKLSSALNISTDELMQPVVVCYLRLTEQAAR